MRRYSRNFWLMLFVIAALIGCTTTGQWKSTPTVQTVENAYFEARFEPMMWGSDVNFFNAFRLTITNKTAEDMEIDWTSTLYMINGQPHSRFVWAGIGQENVNNPPPDTVSAGRDFSRIVVPLRMIAWKPLSSASTRQAFTAGPLLEGRNSIDLIITQGNQQVRERLTVDIRVK